MKYMIDPPMGWRYGFPKEVPHGTENIADWLIQEGYPKEIMEEMGDYFICSHWYEEEDEGYEE